MAQPAPNWNAEATDAKGYWVATPAATERVDVDWNEISSPGASASPASRVEARRPRPEPVPTPPPAPAREPRAARRAKQRLPVAPIAEAALPADFAQGEFEVPEFTISEREPATDPTTAEMPKARWEILDTYVPDALEEAPTEEVARAPARNVKVFARSRAFTEAISHDLPGAQSAGAPIEQAPAEPLAVVERPVAPAPSEERTPIAESAPVHERPSAFSTPAVPEMEPSASLGPVARVQVSPEGASPPAELSLEAKRALARAMAAKAAATAREHASSRSRNPGSLPPVAELSRPTTAEAVLSQRSQESWSWDEADPLATPTPAPPPRRPSLSVVQSAPNVEAYADTLATPLPAPPRPDVVVPWPLPVVRARIGRPLHAPDSAAYPPQDVNAYEGVVPEHDDDRAFHASVHHQPASVSAGASSLGLWLGLAAGFVLLMGAAFVGSVSIFALAVAAALLG